MKIYNCIKNQKNCKKTVINAMRITQQLKNFIKFLNWWCFLRNSHLICVFKKTSHVSIMCTYNTYKFFAALQFSLESKISSRT